MTTQVKICGLKRPDDIDVAIENGADYVGLVFFEPSPRNLAISEARALAEHIAGRAKVVALTVDADDQLIMRIARDIAPDIFQLHGSEDAQRIRAVATMTGSETMKVIKVATTEDVQAAFDFNDIADHILFDAKAPKGWPLPGGNGLRFDWRILDGISERLTYMLAAGLTPENVGAAIAQTGAAAVDVSSGVESAPGIKDPARIRAFLRATKGL